MPRLFRYPLAMGLLLLATLTVSAQTKPVLAKTQAQEGEFKALIERYYAAWNTANAENAAPFYAKEADRVFYDLAPLKYTGWAEYKEGVKKHFFDHMASGMLTPQNDLKVTRRGTIAWTTVTFHLSARMKDGKAIETDGRHTAIWEKQGGKWLIIHEHVSAPLPAS